MLHFNGYDVILLLLPCDLIKQEMLCVAAGALDRTGLKGIGQVRVAQSLQIAAAAANEIAFFILISSYDFRLSNFADRTNY